MYYPKLNVCYDIHIVHCDLTLTAMPTASVPKEAADGAALGTFPVHVSLMKILDMGTLSTLLATWTQTS